MDDGAAPSAEEDRFMIPDLNGSSIEALFSDEDSVISNVLRRRARELVQPAESYAAHSNSTSD